MKKNVLVKSLLNDCRHILASTGLDSVSIETILQHYLYNEQTGHVSHGFIRFKKMVATLRSGKGLGRPRKVETSIPHGLLIDGNNSNGIVAAKMATDSAIDLANKHGICFVGMNNYEGNTGSLGYYIKELTDQNLISICFCNNIHTVAPWGGSESILGTNPIAIGIPSQENPILIDFATSAISFSSTLVAAQNNEKMPSGLIYDPVGKPSTNPMDAKKGCIVSMGKHKGYALGLAIEILAGPLIKAKAGKVAVKGSEGFVIIGINPEVFTKLEFFKEQVSALINEIVNSRVAEDHEGIKIPGENSLKKYLKQKDSKFISISQSTLSEISALGAVC